MTGPSVIPLTVTLLLTLLGAPQSPAKILLPAPTTSPDLTDLCPFSSFCTHTSNQSIPDPTLQSCCLPCSCDPGCGSVNKCCPDVQNAAVPAKVYPCRYVSEIISSYLNNSEWKSGGRHAYSVIDECPYETIISPEMNESVSSCYTANAIQDLLFVTGSVSGRTYLNKHCAICNNEFIYTEWGMFAADNLFLQTVTSFEERDKRILESGGIVLVPPSREIGLGAICSKYTRNTCNVTGKWNYYDKEIETKCNAVTMDFYRAGWDLLVTDANVYCFLCNHPKGTTVPSVCQRIDINTVMDRRGPTSFSALISQSPLTVDEESDCEVGEIMDPFRMQCTELLCPIGSFAQNGDCVNFVDDLVGLQVRLHMLVRFDATMNMSNMTLDEALIRDLRQVVMRQVNRGTIYCGICMSVLLLDTLTGDVTFDTTLYSTYRCSITDLLTGLFRLFTQSVVQVTLPRTKLPVKLTNQKSDWSMIEQLASIGNQACYNVMFQFFTEETIHCPSIILNRNVSEFVTNERAASEIMSSAVEVGNDTVRVCVNKYMSVFRSTHGRATTVGQSVVVSVFVSVLAAWSHAQIV